MYSCAGSSLLRKIFSIRSKTLQKRGLKSSSSGRHYEFHCLTTDETGGLGTVECFIWHCSPRFCHLPGSCRFYFWREVHPARRIQGNDVIHRHLCGSNFALVYRNLNASTTLCHKRPKLDQRSAFATPFI